VNIRRSAVAANFSYQYKKMPLCFLSQHVEQEDSLHYDTSCDSGRLANHK